MRDLVRDLALALRERVLPMVGSHAGRAHADALGAGGDVTFKKPVAPSKHNAQGSRLRGSEQSPAPPTQPTQDRGRALESAAALQVGHLVNFADGLQGAQGGRRRITGARSGEDQP